MNAQEIFELNMELTADEVVMEMYQEAEDCDTIKDCQTAYNRLALEAGLIKSPSDRKEEWLNAIKEVDLSTDEGIAEAKELGESVGITSVTVNRYIKAEAAAQGIEIPVVVKGLWSAVVEEFTESEALTESREYVVEKINEVGEYNDLAKANSLYNKLRKAFGWNAPASMSSQLNAWFIENIEASKDDIVDKGIDLGMTQGSATYYVGVYRIVREILEGQNADTAIAA